MTSQERSIRGTASSGIPIFEYNRLSITYCAALRISSSSFVAEAKAIDFLPAVNS